MIILLLYAFFLSYTIISKHSLPSNILYMLARHIYKLKTSQKHNNKTLCVVVQPEKKITKYTMLYRMERETKFFELNLKLENKIEFIIFFFFFEPRRAHIFEQYNSVY